MSGLALHWLDVFTDVPFAGNPLAVVLDADDLSSERMQRIAAELGLSETVFVLEGAERLRIFTPTSELPLAGHPVVGTTVLLERIGLIGARHVFQTGAGSTPVEVADGVATMTQAPLELGREVAAAAVVSALRLEDGALTGTPRVASTSGIQQLFARVRDRETLASIAPDLGLVAEIEGIDGIVAWCEHGEELAQRFFMPVGGIPEDPATGSAAGALCALRVLEGAPPGSVVVRQGAEIGRPSEMHVEVRGTPGAPDPPLVGGRAVPVLEANLAV